MSYKQHGRRHAPGGTDPIDFTKSGWGFGRFIAVDTGDLGAVANNSLTAITFTGLSIVTNDTSVTDSINTVSSPFTGEHFTADWSSSSTHISITTQGVYLVHRYFSVQSYASAPANPFTVTVEQTGTAGGWELANENLAANNAILANGSASSGNWNARLDEMLFVTSSATAGLSVEQDAGAATTHAFAGISIVRLGDLTS